MQTNQVAQDQTNANADADAQQGSALEGKYKEARFAVSMALEADGVGHGSNEQAVNVSKLLKVRPELRSEILAILHETPGLGNSFVQMVMNFHRHPEAAAVQGVGTVDAKPGSKPALSQQEVRDMADGGKEDGKNAAASTSAQSSPGKDAATPAPPAKDDAQAAPQSELGPAPPGGWRAPNLSATERSKLNDDLEGSAPASKGPTPGPQSAEAKQEEPAPQHKNEAPPTNEVAPPGKQDIAAAGQGPAPAPPAQEAAPKADAKADEKGKDEKPEAKADGTEVKITASALRVRAEPSTKGAILGKIPRGKTAKVVGHENAWLKIEWDGKEAYIFAKYTTSVKGNESGEEEQEGEQSSSQEQKPERPKNPPMVNDEQNQQGVLV